MPHLARRTRNGDGTCPTPNQLRDLVKRTKTATKGQLSAGAPATMPSYSSEAALAIVVQTVHPASNRVAPTSTMRLDFFGAALPEKTELFKSTSKKWYQYINRSEAKPHFNNKLNWENCRRILITSPIFFVLSLIFSADCSGDSPLQSALKIRL